MENKASRIEKKYNETKNAGLSVFCMMDMIVLPKSLIQSYDTKILDEKTDYGLGYPVDFLKRRHPGHHLLQPILAQRQHITGFQGPLADLV